jgi:hypothetical protein
MVSARDGMPQRLRRCNNCGKTAMRRNNGNCKKWCPETKTTVHCGTMRVVKEGKPNIIRMVE